MKNELVQFVECPRDAMQGWSHFIPTEKKIGYLNSLLQVGFHTLDFGSFVSPKAIPQLADTAAVLKGLKLEDSPTKLLAIVANSRGAGEAASHDEISFIGFPFSLSETFQQRNTNSSIAESLTRVEEIQNLCLQKGKRLVIYLSMGFGNPYGDPYTGDILLHWAEAMVSRGIGIISLADTVGVATPEQISFALNALIPNYPQTTFGVHLHSTPDNWKQKLEAALSAGCRRIDGALKGIGGCPLAGNALVGNLPSERVLPVLKEKKLLPAFNQEAFSRSLQLANAVFIND